MNYLYNDGEMWHFMDPESFEQIAADKTAMGDAAKWLKDDSNETCTDHVIQRRSFKRKCT